MQIQCIKKALATCLATLIVLAGSSSVLAVPPATIAVGPWQTFGILTADCGDFNVLWDGTVDGYIKVFFDKDGNFKKYVEFYRTANHDSTYYIAGEPHVSIRGHPVEVQKITWYPDGTQAIIGLSMKITIPGHGVIVHDAGRIIFDVITGEVLFQAGPGDLYADPTPYCDYFDSLR